MEKEWIILAPCQLGIGKTSPVQHAHLSMYSTANVLEQRPAMMIFNNYPPRH